MSIQPTNPVPQNSNNGVSNFSGAPASLGQQANAAGMPHGTQTGFDIWGPLQRRKYLVTLFCIIGLGLGGVYYAKTPKVYASSAQLMVTVQAPPRIIDGTIQKDKVSLPSQISLITSELVLDAAAENGLFNEMRTFAEEPFDVLTMKEDMLSVIPGEEDGETFTVVCRGSDPDELPVIVNQIVASYRAVMIEDSQTDGKKAVDLIQSIASKLSNEKNIDEQDRNQLLRKLGVEAADESGNVVNPHSKLLLSLKEEEAELNRLLRETTQRLDQHRLSLKNIEGDEEKRKVAFKVAAHEAQEYLKLERKVVNEGFMMDRVARSLEAEIRQRNNLEEREWQLETKISDFRIERARMSDVFGAGYKAIATIDDQIEYLGGQLAEVQQDLEQVDKVIAERSQKNGLNSDITNKPIDLDTFREKEDREWIDQYRKALTNEINRLQASLVGLNQEIVRVTKNSEAVAESVIELNMLNEKIDERRQAVGVILDRVAEMDVMANSYTKTTVRVLDEPKYGEVVAPSLLKSLAIGMMLSFMAGLGLAILVDQSELAFRSPHEILERLRIPVVGRIPRINTRKVDAKIGNAALIAAHKPASTGAEAFRDVRTGLFFRSSVDDLKTILFTSPSPGDGKSTAIGNVAISIAQAGKRVILVDADFRRPRVHQYFAEDIKPGLLDVLSGELNLKDAIRPAKLQDNLFLLTTGGRPANPGELVTSEAFKELISALRERFDYVLIDAPPVLPVSDPASIASIVDGVYLVTRIRKGVKLTAQKAKDTLDAVGANWIGIIVNGIDENPHYSEYGYQYGNYSYYGGLFGKYYDSNNKAYREKITVSSDD